MADRAVAVIVQNKHLLVIHRQKPDQDYYVLPGGSVEEGESIKQACIREVEEETGLIVVLQEQIWTHVNNVRSEHYFRVTVVGGELQLSYPEAARQSPFNRYTLKWVDAEQLAQINLQPTALRDVVRRYMQ